MPVWPLVDPLDDGIRPAGRPDECLYCHARIGQRHEPDCTIVTKRIEMLVTAHMPDGNVFTGLWHLDVPHSWDSVMCEFHKNDSSWCASNVLHERESITWDTPVAWDRLEAATSKGACLYDWLSFPQTCAQGTRDPRANRLGQADGGLMKVKELIELLKDMPQDMEVCAWDADADEYLPVTGALFEDGHTTVDLQTDPEP